MAAFFEGWAFLESPFNLKEGKIHQAKFYAHSFHTLCKNIHMVIWAISTFDI